MNTRKYVLFQYLYKSILKWGNCIDMKIHTEIADMGGLTEVAGVITVCVVGSVDRDP